MHSKLVRQRTWQRKDRQAQGYCHCS